MPELYHYPVRDAHMPPARRDGHLDLEGRFCDPSCRQWQEHAASALCPPSKYGRCASPFKDCLSCQCNACTDVDCAGMLTGESLPMH